MVKRKQREEAAPVAPSDTTHPEGVVELTIAPFEPLPFVGCVELSVQSGTLCLLGAELAAGSGWHAVHSPAGGLPLAFQTNSALSCGVTVHLRAIDPASEGLSDADVRPDESNWADSGAKQDAGALAADDQLLASLADEDEDEDEDEDADGEGEEGDADGDGAGAVWGAEAEPEPNEEEEDEGMEGEDARAGAAEPTEEEAALQRLAGAARSAGRGGKQKRQSSGRANGKSPASGSVSHALVLHDTVAVSPLPSQLGLHPAPVPLERCVRLGALVPAEWEDAVEEVCRLVDVARAKGTRPPVVMLCGARNSGKSSLLRLLANRLLVPRGGAGAAAQEEEEGRRAEGKEDKKSAKSSKRAKRASAVAAADAALALSAVATPPTARGVALLDTDVGQPELGPPGLVSLRHVAAPLLGPAHAHGRASHVAAAALSFFGAVSPAAEPAAFLRAVEDTLAVYYTASATAEEAGVSAGSDGATETPTQPLASLPLLVNTCGWVQGLGLQLLADTLAVVQPTLLIVLERAPGSGRANTSAASFPLAEVLPTSGRLPLVMRIAALEPIARAPRAVASAEGGVAPPSAPLAPTAAEARDLQLLAYFGAVPRDARSLPASSKGYASSPAWGAAVGRLLAATPYAVSASALRLELLHHAPLSRSEMLVSLNAAVVGLLTDDTSAACVGLAIVRSVDAASGTLLLVTPIPPEQLRLVTRLLRGSIDLPVALLQPTRETAASDYLSVGALRGAGAATKEMKSRNNIVRASAAR